ncbi:hypothetical protein NHX12_031483 [Muraenolepis orangiensis]|uniref:Uncharacterized protein n=1 Tax=Muraenolepis orangiensis TaxID=630683 RepID=A0A9Q0E440_9TELE|nr:hypothetical protein NHX12_031483 [Muraenolepis orangiensis]
MQRLHIVGQTLRLHTFISLLEPWERGTQERNPGREEPRRGTLGEEPRRGTPGEEPRERNPRRGTRGGTPGKESQERNRSALHELGFQKTDKVVPDPSDTAVCLLG